MLPGAAQHRHSRCDLRALPDPRPAENAIQSDVDASRHNCFRMREKRTELDTAAGLAAFERQALVGDAKIVAGKARPERAHVREKPAYSR